MFTLLEICEYRMEMAAYSYFRWRLNSWEISLYREKAGSFQFWVDLPFIHINNVMERRIVQDIVPITDKIVGVNPHYHTISITSGKVFFWKI